MGLETGALLSAIGSAATTAVVGAVASYALAPKPDKQAQQVAPVTAADKPPQAQQAPNYQALKAKDALAAAAGGANSGWSSTLLTGSMGQNAGGLNLGTNSLLGQ